jgi:DNA polymerase-3 subunit delta'
MNSSIVGHAEIRERLLDLLKKEKLSHANILVGPSGIGKKLVAREIAKACFCESGPDNVCNTCQSCQLFESGNHPDFYTFECKDNGLIAEDARIFLNSINLKPFKAGKRVVIFNDADGLSTVVANLLLKTLEEPRNDSLFFLIAANPSKLPLPVLSRCQAWRFGSLTKREVEQIVSVHVEPKQIESIAELCDGSLEQLQNLKDSDKESSAIRKTLLTIIAGDEFQALTFAATLAKDKGNLDLKLGIIKTFLRYFLAADSFAANRLAIAEALENIIIAKNLIANRNFAPLNLLEICFYGLSGKDDSSARSISEIVL